MNGDILNRITKIVAEKLAVEKSRINPEAHFTRDPGADSLDAVDLIIDFEKEFNVSIPDIDAEKIVTVRQAMEYMGLHEQ